MERSGSWRYHGPRPSDRNSRSAAPSTLLVFNRDGKRLLTGSARAHSGGMSTPARLVGPRMHCKRYEPDKKVQQRDGQRTLDVVDTVEATALSPDATTLATAGWTGHEERVRGRAEIWNATTGERLRATPEQPNPLYGVVYSPDSKWLLTWDEEPKSAIVGTPPPCKTAAPSCAHSMYPSARRSSPPRGDVLLLACQDGTARFWDVALDKEISPSGGLRHGYPVTAAAFSPRRPAGRDRLPGRHRLSLESVPADFSSRYAGQCRRGRCCRVQPRRQDTVDRRPRRHGAFLGRRVGKTARTVPAPHRCRSLRGVPSRRPERGDRHEEREGATVARSRLAPRRDHRRHPERGSKRKRDSSSIFRERFIPGWPGRSLSSVPNDPMARGEHDERAQDYRAIGVGPGRDPCACRLGRTATRPVTHSCRRRNGLWREDWPAAEARARSVLKTNSSDPHALRLLARTSARQGRDESAEAIYRRLGTKFMEAEDFFLLGRGLLGRGQVGPAPRLTGRGP